MNDPSYFPITWASDITVESQGDKLLVTGKLPQMDSDVDDHRDPYLSYVRSVKTEFAQKQTGKNSPHIQFANAGDDALLIAFVREFGPVVPAEVHIVEPLDTENMTLEEHESAEHRSSIAAVQTLSTLRREQRIYAAALRLMMELTQKEGESDPNAILRHVSEIADGTWYWLDQYELESAWRKAQYLYPPAWHFDEKARNSLVICQQNAEWRVQFEKTPAPNREDYRDWQSYSTAYGRHMFSSAMRPKSDDVGHRVLCSLINSFRTEVQHLQNHPVEALQIFSLRFGIRPALYLILKNEYLGRGSATICGNDRCSHFFVRARAGARFCSAECSQHFRQRKYFAEKGSEKRRRRKAKAKSATKQSQQRS